MTDPDVARTLDATVRFLRRFVVLNGHQSAAVALYVFHTHATEAAESTPYLSVTSAVPRSGKSRLLEVQELLVAQPMQTANISDAALFRAIQKLHPTLLFDEIDAIFGPKARDREDLRGMLNAGYRRGAVAYRMGGANNRVLEAFDVFCPKVFAGIGELPTTIRDRSIRIRLERRTAEERIERFRRRDADEEAQPLHDSVASLASHHVGRLAEARPALPDELDDRAWDVWEPLLAIADLAGQEWSKRARKAAVALSGGAAREDDSSSVQLLRDLHTVFSEDGIDSFKTADLITKLSEIEESPWGDWYGKPISPQALGKLLRPFQIRTKPVWVSGQAARGYKVEQFVEAWFRVLGVRGVRGVRPGSQSQNDLTDPNALTLSENEGVRSEPAPEAEPNTPNAPNAHHSNNGHEPDFPTDREWLARDGAWRSFSTDPPAFPGEVVKTRGDVS